MNDKPYRDSDREKAERIARRDRVASIAENLRWIAGFIEADERDRRSVDHLRKQLHPKIWRVCEFFFSEC
jgi:hypothetical protein